MSQRIGFNATNQKGQPILVEGCLKNSKGITLDTIKSGIYGPGIFTCVPETGMYVELFNGEYQNKIWPIDNINTSGYSLSVKPTNNRNFNIEVQASNYTNELLHVCGNMNSTQIFDQELRLDKKKRITISTDALPAGVVQISLCDKEMNPLAQRLVYVNADKHLKFNISSDTSIYNPGQETELSISTIST